ncbi:MAG: response regulator transcription factor [Bacteroidota bacterium]|nr:response regulator transcription factor [Bacteroidota bacterium]
MSKILIIEDEPKISRFVELELVHEGYEVITAFDGRSGLEQALSNDIDLVILDLMLPELNGIEVCRRIRRESDVPIIILTAKDDVSDKVMGLDMGADDYLTKPFAIEELLARIRVAFKRKNKTDSTSNMYIAGKLSLSSDRRIVTYDDKEISLSKKEFDLLEYLMINKNIVLNREKILEKVWGFDFYGDTNIVDVYIKYLRTKIDQKYGIEFIHTVRGVGYIFDYE